MIVDVERVFSLVERLNFTVRNIYNIIVIGDVEAIIEVSKWVKENRGMAVETGFVNGTGRKASGLCSL